MDSTTRTEPLASPRQERLGGSVQERRRFLKQMAAAGAVAGAAALPAMAQESGEPRRSTAESGPTVAETLARYASGLTYEDLPPQVVRTVKRTILDTIGCGIGAYTAGPSRIAIKLASGVSARQGATVLCSGIKSSHELAVFANGVMMRYLDFNDGYITPMGGGHPSDTIAALLSSAEIALFSAQLAQAGMTGPSQVFEGQLGFFNVIARKPFDLPRLGEPFGIMRAFTKRFPLGQYSQTVAEAAAQVRSFFASTDEIEEINIRVSQNAIKVMAGSPEKWRPQSHETADHSMPYAVGIVLMYGTIEEHHYEDPYLHDQRLLDLVSRVRCIPSAEADRHEKEYNLCDLEIVLKSGQRTAARVEYHRGHWRNPMSDAEMEEKFRGLARKHLPAERVDALLHQLWTLEDLPQAGKLAEMTRV